uniref:Uncharacterized protein n=1 Tax=Knipowitschia caucasica TaxID=637954 RepID=A0AAV2LRB4_KNICA
MNPPQVGMLSSATMDKMRVGHHGGPVPAASQTHASHQPLTKTLPSPKPLHQAPKSSFCLEPGGLPF